MAKNYKPVKNKGKQDAAKKENTQDQFFKRVLHRAYLRDGDITHTGEALALALLLHAKGKDRKVGRNEVAKMLDDPNA